jgi:hypothetical protein
MVKKKDVFVAVIVTFLLVMMMFIIVPVLGPPNAPYDAFFDYNGDGKIGPADFAYFSTIYGSQGAYKPLASIAYNSGWINITDKCGQYFNITHDLNSTDVIIDIQGKATSAGGVHQRNLGLTGYGLGWSENYGGTNSDEAYSVVQTSDGGYALAGYTGSFGAGSWDFYLVKTDLTGTMLWNKTYGGTNSDVAHSVVQTSDGGYALAGYTNSFGIGGNDVYLVRTDSSGNMQWNKTYGGPNRDEGYSVIQTGDGGYAIAGYTDSFGAGSYDFSLVKTDAAGNIQWNKTYGTPFEDYGRSIVQTSDGGYAIAGSTMPNGDGFIRSWLVKTDAVGNMQWNQTYGKTNGFSDAYSLIETSDGGYALAGYIRTDTWDFGLVKTDSSGNMQWNKTYGGSNPQEAYSVVQTSDEGYAIAGATVPYNTSREEFLLVKTDAEGTMLWNKTYGGTGNAEAACVVQTSDGGYALVGYTDSYSAGGRDVWLVKTDVESGLAWTNSDANTITLYRGATDAYWNFVRVRVWQIKEIP